MRNILIYIAVACILLGGVYGLGKLSERKNTQRQKNNYLALLQAQNHRYDSTTRVINLTKEEIKKQMPELVKQIRQDFDVKLRNINSAQNVNTVTNTNVHTFLKDSTIMDSVKIQVADYHDKWTDLHMIKLRDSVQVKIRTTDSLLIVVHKVPRKLGQWLRGEPKQVSSDIKSYNPNSKILYQRYIQISK
jgi:hypothetical protein